jgi:hypothetical protein
MTTVNDTRIADILTRARQGLMPEVNSAIQIRALLNLAGMTLRDTPRVDVSQTRQGRRFRVHIGGHDVSVPTVIGSATTTKVFMILNRAGCKDILAQSIKPGERHEHHSLGNMSDGRGVQTLAMFIEFYS